MGEVYRARDSRLRRDVALKILPEFFASDADRLVRFQREAQALAALNHPHVASIYGLEESNGHRALVLELIEGETLAERIGRGAIPVAEALPIARQIAEALEYAHEHGVVHRDLKPSNIKIAPSGAVKVLDFGLAKLSDGTVTQQPDASTSPTIDDISRVGVLIGTAAYMSPEQARRKPADKRSDVWAFGCVVYEMLSGRRAFEGTEVTDILANILKSSPDWTRLPGDTPAAVRRLLRRCLEKDRTQRLPDIGSARLEIVDAMTPGAEPVAALEPASVKRRANWIPWTIAAASLVAAAVALVLWAPWRTPPAVTPTRVTVELGTDAAFAVGPGTASAVLSPDGRTLAFIAQPAGRPRQLFVRRMDQLQATALPGTEEAVSPFFSPDGEWLGFFASGKLKKISASGGATITLADAAGGRGGSWTERDTIIFGRPSAPALEELPAAGGNAVSLTSTQGAFSVHPHALPGSSGVLFTAMTGPGALSEATLMVQRPGGEPQVVVRGAHYGRYVASGHLLYMSQGTVFAAPFDLDSLKLIGDAVPVLEGVQFNAGGGAAQFEVSRAGTLVFTPGIAQSGDRPLSWLNQSGAVTTLKSGLGNWGTPRFSPDGRRIAMTRVVERGNADIWTYDLERETLVRVTLDNAAEAAPVWTADGRRIVFGSTAGGGNVFNLYWKRADGTGEAQRLTESKIAQLPSSWHPTRPILAFHDGTPPSPQRVVLLEIEGDEANGWRPKPPTELIAGTYRNVMPVFSPDGNWIAYLSDKSGRFELYVRPFPGPGDEVQVSNGGANDAKWSLPRREILYDNLGAQGPNQQPGQIMVAPYTVQGKEFKPEKPRLWTQARVSTPPFLQLGLQLDLHPDGQRLAVAAAPQVAPGPARDSVVVVFNFLEDLKRRVPPGE